MKRFLRGLSATLLVTGLLLVSAPVSAAPIPSRAEVASASSAHAVKPPVIKKVRYTCHDEGAIVALRLRNPNQVEQSFQVTLSGGEVAEAQAVTLAPRTAERLEFHGLPNARYQIQVLNDIGDVVAQARVRVNCPPVA